jgi:hypothetical protein
MFDQLVAAAKRDGGQEGVSRAVMASDLLTYLSSSID